jgi:5'-nucleotidase
VPFTPTPPTPTTIHLVAINDFHGNLRPPAPLRGATDTSDPVAVGGIDALAAHVRAVRASHPDALVVSAGDLIGASPLVSGLFHDEPTIEAMNLVGLDLNAVGNHEFDDGTAELLRMQAGGCHPSADNTCLGAAAGLPEPFEGAKFQFLAANVRRDGETIFPAYAIRTVGGRKIAFIGLTLEGTPAIVDRAGIADLTFADEVETINAEVSTLRAAGVRAIVVLLHEGGEVTGPRNVETLNDCAGMLEGSPLRRIVAALDDEIDLVVSGHTHQAYVCALPNAAGRPIAVTSAHDYGRVVTDIALTVDGESGDVTRVDAANVALVRGATTGAQSPLDRLVEGYERLAEPLANRVIGRIGADFSPLPNEAGESALGALIADAQLAATRDAGAEIALMNPGGIRAGLAYASGPAGEGDGRVTYGEAYTVQPFANALVTLTLTGADLHDLLEQQFAGCSGQRGTRILPVSEGFEYAWSADAPACARIDPSTMRLNHVPIDPRENYRITVNSFLAAGGDDFSVLARARDRVTGVLDLQALEAWLDRERVAEPLAQPRIHRR